MPSGLLTWRNLLLGAAVAWMVVKAPPLWDAQRRLGDLEALPDAAEPVEQQLDEMHRDDTRQERDRAALRLAGGLAGIATIGVAGAAIGRRRGR